MAPGHTEAPDLEENVTLRSRAFMSKFLLYADYKSIFSITSPEERWGYIVTFTRRQSSSSL